MNPYAKYVILATLCLAFLFVLLRAEPPASTRSVVKPFPAPDGQAKFPRTGDSRRLRLTIAKLKPLHEKLGKPRPGEWLAQHEEAGQTFGEYLQTRPGHADRAQDGDLCAAVGRVYQRSTPDRRAVGRVSGDLHESAGQDLGRSAAYDLARPRAANASAVEGEADPFDLRAQRCAQAPPARRRGGLHCLYRDRLVARQGMELCLWSGIAT